MFKSFSRKSPSPTTSTWSWPKTDVHAHLLPGIDDGPETTEEALDLVEHLHEMGYERLVATPHIMSGLYPNTTENVRQTYEAFQSEIEKRKTPIKLSFAAEYFMDESFEELLNKDELLTFFGNYVLIEMSTLAVFPRYHEYIFKLKTKGYKPILAHPERYVYFHNDWEAYEKIKHMGCLFQINILSLQGYYGKKIKACAIQLIEKKMGDLLGSDVHHLQHIKSLKKAFSHPKLNHLLADFSFRNDQL